MGLFGKSESDRYRDELASKRSSFPTLADSQSNCAAIQIQIQQLKNISDYAAAEQTRSGCADGCQRVNSRSQKVANALISEKKAQLSRLNCSQVFTQEFNQAGQEVFDEFTSRADERIGNASTTNMTVTLIIGAVTLIGAMIILMNRN